MIATSIFGKNSIARRILKYRFSCLAQNKQVKEFVLNDSECDLLFYELFPKEWLKIHGSAIRPLNEIKNKLKGGSVYGVNIGFKNG